MQVPGELWYPLLESRELKRRPLGVTRLGRRLVFWRTASGVAHALDERCPHLGAALSAGTIEGDQLVCPFHGFHFDGSGRCQHIPAIGSGGRIPEGLRAGSYPVEEAGGFIWLWWGSEPPNGRRPPAFPELANGWHYTTSVIEAPVHYTRAIENQLDVAHIPFVHRTTIGRGGRSFVEGPQVEIDEAGMRVWTSNRLDDGTPAATAEQVAARAAARSPDLQLLFPGLWLLNISERFKNLIAFVPLDEGHTRYYLRAYHRWGNPLIAKPFEWLMRRSNRVILGQDLRVIATQTPLASQDAGDDRPIAADRAVLRYRRWHAQALEGAQK